MRGRYTSIEAPEFIAANGETLRLVATGPTSARLEPTVRPQASDVELLAEVKFDKHRSGWVRPAAVEEWEELGDVDEPLVLAACALQYLGYLEDRDATETAEVRS